MNPTLAQMRGLVAVAKSGSFTRAARAANLSQPALTVQIRQLEQALGVKVLDRNTRSVHLTRLGEELVPVFERMLHELDAVVAGARDLATKRLGIVRIGCLPSVAAAVLPDAIAAFRVRHPGVRFVVKDSVGGKVVELVKAGIVDFGITGGWEGDPELATTVLMRDRLHAIYRTPHPLDGEGRITAASLSSHPLIMMDQESTVRQIVDRAFLACDRPVRPFVEVTYMSTAIGMVRAGLGVALLPSTAIEAGASGPLRSRPVAGKEFARQVMVVRRAGRSLPPASASFLALLEEGGRGPHGIDAASKA